MEPDFSPRQVLEPDPNNMIKLSPMVRFGPPTIPFPSFNPEENGGLKRRRRAYDEMTPDEQTEYRINETQDNFKRATNQLISENKRMRTESARQPFEEPQLPDQETMNLLMRTGSILWCRGLPFDNQIRQVLTPMEYEQWHQISDNLQMLSVLNALPRGIYEKIEVLKTEAICSFVLHYQGLPQSVKLTFSNMFPKYDQELEKIVNGNTNTMNFGFILSSIWQDLATAAHAKLQLNVIEIN